MTRPLVRGGDGLEPVSWSAAISVAAQSLRELLQRGDVVGVLGSARATNEENFLAGRLARCALQTNNVDFTMRDSYQALVSGMFEHHFGFGLASALDDISTSDVTILLEGDVAQSHPQVAHAILMSVRRGARLVTVGPRQTQLSRVAWLHLPLVPGDEAVLAARLLMAADGGGRNSPGRSNADQHKESGDDGGCIMSAAQLQRVLDSYGGASRAAVVLAPNEAPTEWLRAIASGFTKLAGVTGHLERQGSVILPLPYRSNTRGAFEMGVAPHCLPGRRPIDDGAARQRLRRVWDAEPPTDAGFDAAHMIGNAKGLVVLADDPPLAMPSERRARGKLAEMECLVVLDSYMTATVEAARVVLPIASAAEADGTVTSMDGRIQRQRAAIQPPGEARPGWWVLNELTTSFGVKKSYSLVGAISQDVAATIPEYAEALAARLDQKSEVGGVLSRMLGDEGTLEADREEARSETAGVRAAAVSGTRDEYPFRLVRLGSFEWSDDVLVEGSPTLSRDRRSLRKLFPRGFVEMSVDDAKDLGIRDGWTVRVSSYRGTSLVPARLREDVTRRILLVPFGFRDCLEPVLGQQSAADVKVERT